MNILYELFYDLMQLLSVVIFISFEYWQHQLPVNKLEHSLLLIFGILLVAGWALFWIKIEDQQKLKRFRSADDSIRLLSKPAATDGPQTHSTKAH